MLTAHPENADRLYKAAELVQSVERTATPFLFLVVSASLPNVAYHLLRGACDCPDANRRDPFNCKHAGAVAMFVQLERAAAEADRLDVDAPVPFALTDLALYVLDGEGVDLPRLCARCQNEPAILTHRDHWGARCVAAELFGDDDDPAA
jgi:hypothetical protein